MAEPSGQQQQIDPAQARQFAAQFLPDPKLAENMPEADVLTYHGKVRTAVDTAVQTALKERGDFSPEWRKALAGDNPDAIKTLERFQTPKALWESYASLRSKVSSGELKAITPFPANGTEEQKAAWRSEVGLPAKPEDYKVEPPPGVVLGEADKPFVDGWLKHAHALNLPNEAVNAGIAWWGEQRKARMEADAQALAQQKQETEDKLRTEWGAEYRPSMTRIEGMLESSFGGNKELVESIMAAVQTNPEFATGLAKIAFQINPSGLPMPPGAEGQISNIEDWLRKADTLMRTNRREYNDTMAKDYPKYADAYQKQTGKEWGKR